MRIQKTIAQLVAAADIGGTNSRFALFEHQGETAPQLLCRVEIATNSVISFEDLLAEVKNLRPEIFAPPVQKAVLAVAGPVKEQASQLTNISWNIDLKKCSQQNLWPQSKLVNDFVAQAVGACDQQMLSSAEIIQNGQKIPGIRAALGPGTGFGACTLLKKEHVFYPLASEAGHAALHFTQKEHELYKFLQQTTRQKHICAEHILSGAGIVRLHQFLTNTTSTPQAIAAITHATSPLTEIFARFLGRACQNFALHTLPFEGIFLCGGILPKNPHLAKHPAFLQEFLHCPTKHGLLQQIPIALIHNQDCGLYGAASLACQIHKKTLTCLRG